MRWTGKGALAPVGWALVLSVGALGACDKKTADAPPAKTDPNVLALSPAAVANAKLAFVQAGPAQLTTKFKRFGEVKFDQTRLVSVVPRLRAMVREVKVVQGQRVKPGEPLLTLESRDLANIKLSYLEASQRYAAAKRTFDREKKLFERQLATKDAYLQRKRALDEAAVSLHLARQRLKVLGLQQGSGARKTSGGIARFPLRAPLGGSVLEVKATVGAAVSERQVLIKLADLSSVWGEVQVPVQQIQGIQVGQEVPVGCRIAHVKGRGRVLYIAPVADPSTRSVLVRIAIPNPSGAWRPGIAFVAQFVRPGRKVAVAVPRAALHTVDGRQVVFVKKGPTRFEARTVKVGDHGDSRVEIRSGLQAGEGVVSTNSFSLKAELLNREGG